MSPAVQSNSALIASYLQAVIRKDASAVDKYFQPKVEYVVNGASSADAAGALPLISQECHTALPWLGLHRGREPGSSLWLVPSPRLANWPNGGYLLFSLFELRDGLIVKYHFLENTFDVATAFRVGGSWLIDTDSVKHRIPDSIGDEEA